MSEAPLVQMLGVRKAFGGRTILRSIDLIVNAGEVVALVGPNGAGKTTLLRIIASLTRPTAGEVRLGGIRLRDGGDELRRYIGVVSHAPLVYDNLTGAENLHFFARMYDLENGADRSLEVLEQVGLARRRHDLVRTYSRGMVQRLAIARAILHDPPILLMDEPDTGLDPSAAEMLHDLLTLLGGRRRAILLTTHNLDRALSWADRIVIMHEGRLMYTAATHALDAEALRDTYAQVVA